MIMLCGDEKLYLGKRMDKISIWELSRDLFEDLDVYLSHRIQNI